MTRSGNAPRFRATVPRLPVSDLTATLEFYIFKLGFKPLYRFGDDAGVGLGSVIVRFCEGVPITSQDLSIYFEITGTDEIFEQFVTEGVDVSLPPTDQPWGAREFCITDPDGYRLVFGDFRDDSRRPQPSGGMASAIDAMMAGDVEELRRLLKADGELTTRRVGAAYRDGRQATLLHVLMDYPDGRHPSNVSEMASALVKAGADVNALDADGEGSTPLQLLMAIDVETPHCSELTKLLLDAGATFAQGSAGHHGMDAFTTALINGHTDCAALMNDKGYPPDFSWAGAGLGNMDLVRSFFGEGEGGALPADQRADSLGDEAHGAMNCAFLVAAINGQSDVIEYLLDKGMDVNMQPPGSDFAGIGGTALHWAARHGHLAATKLLITRGANVGSRDDVFGLTPAGWAAWYGHSEIRQYLLEQE